MHKDRNKKKKNREGETTTLRKALQKKRLFHLSLSADVPLKGRKTLFCGVLCICLSIKEKKMCQIKTVPLHCSKLKKEKKKKRHACQRNVRTKIQ